MPPVEDHDVHESTRKTLRQNGGCYNRKFLGDTYKVIKPLMTENNSGPASDYGKPIFAIKVIENRMTRLCRQVGERINKVWVELPECVGCTAEKDIEYINKMREMT